MQAVARLLPTADSHRTGYINWLRKQTNNTQVFLYREHFKALPGRVLAATIQYEIHSMRDIYHRKSDHSTYVNTESLGQIHT